ncbi:MAG: hypothetical protein RSD36_08445 [Terrisporobacter sp.]
MKYFDWYTQAMGGVLGLIACIYCYLNGDLMMISNINGNFDMLYFNELIASYTLYPLCIFIFILSIIRFMKSNNSNSKVNKESFIRFNDIMLYFTAIIGILGCKQYFIIAALLIIFYPIKSRINYARENKSRDANDNDIKDETLSEEDLALVSTKKDMAIDLLNNNASINFIIEVTGLGHKEIENLSKDINSCK